MGKYQTIRDEAKKDTKWTPFIFGVLVVTGVIVPKANAKTITILAIALVVFRMIYTMERSINRLSDEVAMRATSK